MQLVNESPYALHLSDFLGAPYFVKNKPFFIEQPVYRYRGNINYALQEIRDSRIHLSPASDFNDPFDSTYHVSDTDLLKEYQFERYMEAIVAVFFPSIELCPASTEMGSNRLMTIPEFLNERLPASLSMEENERVVNRILRQVQSHPRGHLPELKIACFSEVNNSIPMWSYYAANHSGVCLKYDFPLLSAGSEDEKCLLEALTKVHYSNFQPQDLHGTYSYTVKSVQWSHEQEWRLVCKTDDDFVSVPCLTAVYLGLRFDQKNLDLVTDAIQSTQRKIDLYAAQVNPKQYAIDFIRVEL